MRRCVEADAPHRAGTIVPGRADYSAIARVRACCCCSAALGAPPAPHAGRGAGRTPWAALFGDRPGPRLLLLDLHLEVALALSRASEAALVACGCCSAALGAPPAPHAGRGAGRTPWAALFGDRPGPRLLLLDLHLEVALALSRASEAALVACGCCSAALGAPPAPHAGRGAGRTLGGAIRRSPGSAPAAARPAL